MTAINAALHDGLALLEQPDPLTLSQWAEQNFYLSSESSSVEGPWQTLPYQRGIMDVISNDDIREVTIQKCKRIGYTKIITAALGFFLAYLRRSAVMYQPRESDAHDYVRDELNPMLRDCVAVRSEMLADPEKKTKHNTQDAKTFKGAILDIKGGLSSASYRRMTKEVVVYDEIDSIPSDIDDEGDPVTLGDGRLETAIFPKSIRGSTPKLKYESHIERLTEQADVILWRHVKCLGCEELHTLEWSQMTWTDNDPNTVRHGCPHCGYAARHADLPVMDSGGEWRSDDGLREVNGSIYGPDGRVEVEHVAFRVWSAYSYYKAWARIVFEFLKANERSKAGDHAPLKAWTNTVRGETWEEQGEEVEPSSLMLRREDYGPQTIPDDVQLLTCAVDVQGTWLEAEVVGWGYGEESWGIETRRFVGNPDLPKVWSDLDAWLLAPRYRDNGQSMVIGVTFIDSGHAADKVYEFCYPRQHPRMVFAIKGRGVERTRPVVGKPIKQKHRYPVELYTIGSHNAKLNVLGKLKVDVPGPGFCHFPLSYQEDYFDGLTAEYLVSAIERGRRTTKFLQRRKRNEPFDLRCYNLAALYLVRPAWLTHPPKRAEKAEAPEAKKAQVSVQDIAKPRQRASRGRGNQIMGWRGGA